MFILKSIGIDTHICFRYDGMYFPYIVVWYSPIEHRYHFQVFYSDTMARQLITILRNNARDEIYLFAWDTSELAYEQVS